MLEKAFYSLSEFFGRQAGYYRTPNLVHYNEYLIDQPAWLVMSNVHDYRQAVAENSVLYGCIDILASAASNGKKYLVDLNGKEVPWTSGKTGVKQARKLFVDRPNPLQSVKEFNYERAYMYYTFGNNYVYLNNPLKTFDTDLLNVLTMYNLPSEWTIVKQTGMIYDQVDLKGIIAMYCLTNYSPTKEFTPDKIVHFNDIRRIYVIKMNNLIGCKFFCRAVICKTVHCNNALQFNLIINHSCLLNYCPLGWQIIHCQNIEKISVESF